MTYLSFIFVFVVPPSVAMLLLAIWKRNELPRGSFPSVGILIAIALAYTIPWDRHLIVSGVWGYPSGRVLGTLFAIPFEELSFIVLQTLGTGLWAVLLARWIPLKPELPAEPSLRLPSERVRWLGIGVFASASVAGFLLMQGGNTRYLGLLLAWSSPILLLQWAIGGHRLWRMKHLYIASVLPPTLYLWCADRFAIAQGIWYFSSESTTGFLLLGLPLEEALFFLMTNMMVAQGTLLSVGLLKVWQESLRESKQVDCLDDYESRSAIGDPSTGIRS